jgi:hypothetical protein
VDDPIPPSRPEAAAGAGNPRGAEQTRGAEPTRGAGQTREIRPQDGGTETTVRLDARDPGQQTMVTPLGDPRPARSDATASGRAAVPQPLWPQRPKSRKRRGFGDHPSS